MGELLHKINETITDCENRELFNTTIKVTHEELMELRRLLMVDEFNEGLKLHNYQDKHDYFDYISK